MSGKLSNPKINDANKSLSSASAAVQTYCATILQQADITLKEMPDLPKHQKVARQHALLWNETVLPGLSNTNADIIGFANQFTAFYKKMVDLADKIATDRTARDSLLEALSLLRNTIKGKKAAADAVKSTLEEFQRNLNADHTTFLSDAKAASALYEGASGVIAKLSSDIYLAQRTLNSMIGVMAGGAVGIAGGAIMIFVGALAEIETAGVSTGLILGGIGLLAGGIGSEIAGGTEYALTVNRMESLYEQLRADKHGLLAVKVVQGHLDGLVEQIAAALTAIGTLIQQWSNLDDSLGEVIEDMDKTPGTSGAELKAELARANEDWKLALSLAINMQSISGLTTKFINNIKDAFSKSG